MSGWKKMMLSMAGRTVLIKSVVQTVPSYMMQSFLLPRSLLKQMDRRIKKKFWGFDDTTQTHLHVKSWSAICQSKAARGLGIRLLVDTNASLLTKCAWQLCTTKDRIWVKMIRAKYLRGRRMLDATRIHGSNSWLRNRIKQCIPYLREGACFHIEAQSTRKIIRDPWLPNVLGFKITADTSLGPRLIFLRDLMDSTGRNSDSRKIDSNFPQHICREILNTPILEKGQERLIWTPSTTGVFTVKSAYRLITKNWCIVAADTPRIWNALWNSKLHG